LFLLQRKFSWFQKYRFWRKESYLRVKVKLIDSIITGKIVNLTGFGSKRGSNELFLVREAAELSAVSAEKIAGMIFAIAFPVG
jgi:hypothetical protein